MELCTAEGGRDLPGVLYGIPLPGAWPIFVPADIDAFGEWCLDRPPVTPELKREYETARRGGTHICRGEGRKKRKYKTKEKAKSTGG